MDLMSPDPMADYPALAGLATAFALAHADDEAAGKAAHNAIRILRSASTVLHFDGVELRVLSEGDRAEGTWYVTDGESCTCKARSHHWCKHRVVFRLLAALATLRGPGLLRAAIAEQTGPIAAPDADLPIAAWDADLDYLTYDPWRQPARLREAAPAAPAAPFRPRITTRPVSDSRVQADVDALYAKV